ncbi:helix-turn-helix domain-containing protein [Brevibacillus sp. HB1.4B]|uniref:helix-turn-helix domain-containing protein n=1 Tax=Brevibacillus sp. HB1.4B TaxID=2738845 RepID=UPI00352E23BA
MSDKSQCYPTIEMMVRNIGYSSKSVERHIKELAGKKSPVTTTHKNPPPQPVGKWREYSFSLEMTQDRHQIQLAQAFF